MKKQLTNTLAVCLLAGSSLSQAAPVGDVSGGGLFNDQVEQGDAWAAGNGQGVDFWTLTVGSQNQVSIAVEGDYDFGISVYEGIVDTDFMSSFDNDADYSYGMGNTAVFVDGTAALYGPFNVLETTLNQNSTYTIAVGGVNGVLGSDYSMEVQAVPVPAAVWLFGSALLGLAGIKRRR